MNSWSRLKKEGAKCEERRSQFTKEKEKGKMGTTMKKTLNLGKGSWWPYEGRKKKMSK